MAERMGKTRPLSRKQVNENVPDQSGVYDLINRNGEVAYTGSAGAGRLRQRLNEHIVQGDVPGATQFRVRPTSSTKEARRVEGQRIANLKPPYNTQSK